MRRLGLLFVLCACVQTTGGNLVSFSATASGPQGAQGSLSFTSAAGFDVTLTRAKLFIGALYFNQTNPASYSLDTTCYLPGIYTGEVRGPLVVDALDEAPQRFPSLGSGTDLPTRAAEVWLTAGAIDADDDRTVALDVAGTATRGSDAWPFAGTVTIGANRVVPPRSTALPGTNPICRERIVTPVPAQLTLAEAGTVQLTVKPQAWFDAVDFSKLSASPSDPAQRVFIDNTANATEPDVALFNALRSTTGPYELSWSPR